MKKGRKQPKQGHLGPAFHNWLEFLEGVEYSLFNPGKKPPRGQPILALNNQLWEFPEEGSKEDVQLMKDITYVHAALAPVARSSVKYKMTSQTCIDIASRYENELTHIGHTVPLRLPHEWCTIVFTEFGADDLIVMAQEQVAEDHKTYPELGLEADETFICLNVAGFRKTGIELEDGTISKADKLSEFPVEIHLTHNQPSHKTKVVYAGAGGIEPKQAGHQALDLIYKSFLLWHHQFHLQSLLRHKSVPGGRPPASFRPRQMRKKHEHPQFEHTIIQLEVDAPEPSQTGLSVFQPHKRLHQVRGFWRHMKKTGKRVWVRPHWRGDETLGVVKRDFELVTHEEPKHV